MAASSPRVHGSLRKGDGKKRAVGLSDETLEGLLKDSSESLSATHEPAQVETGAEEGLKEEASYLFKYIMAIQTMVFMESGALPAVLRLVKASFAMTYAEQGLLGGIIYLTTAIGARVDRL